jgi:hypothetical protein
MIREKVKPTEIVIDTTGPDGNAYGLIKLALKYAHIFGWDGDAIKAEMMAGDYDNLLTVFDNHFGDFITLEIAKETNDA